MRKPPVIVCHCHVVSDQAITAAADLGARTVAANCRTTGAARDCGSCVFNVKRVLCEHERSQQRGQMVAAGDVLMEVDGAAS